MHSLLRTAALSFLLSFACAAIAQEAITPEIANHKLAEQGISVDNDSFIAQVEAGKLDNVRLFHYAGANASSQNKDGTTGLMAALKAPTPDMLNLLLSELGPNSDSVRVALNLKDNTERTVLIHAIELGNEQFVDMLLAHGADITATGPSRATPLITALKQKNEAIVKKILAVDEKSTPAFATVELEDAKGNKALTYAIDSQMPELVKLLLASKADAVTPDSLGVTPLMVAAKGGDESIAQMLIDAGANINTVAKSGHTPISIAIRAGNGKLARLLIEKDPKGSANMNYATALTAVLEADKIDPEFFAYLLDHTSKTETLPAKLLFTALDRKNLEVTKLLMARKPDMKARNQAGETLFYHAVDAGFEDIALELMQNGSDTTQSGEGGSTPVARAVRHNMAKVVEALIAKGASVDQKTPEGYTLAEICVYSGYAETLEVLLKHGVSLEKQFALLWSIRDGKGKAVPVLLKHGASTAIMNQDGVPAITLAAEAGETEAVKAFIEHKAMLDYPSRNLNMTALASAARSGHGEIVKMLVEAGAKIDAVDNYGMTPLGHAAYASKPDIVAYLLGKGANARYVDTQKRGIIDIAGQSPASPERDKVIQLLSDAGSNNKPAP